MNSENRTIDFTDSNSQDLDLKEWLQNIISLHPVLSRAFRENRAGVLIADISKSRSLRWAEVNADLEIYGASVPKLGILLGILHNNANASGVQKEILNDFKDEISAMIKKSNNLESGKLYALTSLNSIKEALYSLQLYQWDDILKTGAGGIWCGGCYNVKETREWFDQNPDILEKYEVDFKEERSPKSGEVFVLTARAGASFLGLMHSGKLINPEYSAIAKQFLEKISTSKFLKGIVRVDNQANWFGKTGTYNGHLSEVALIEGKDYSYILSFLISNHRDNEVFEYFGEHVTSLIKNG